VYKSQPSAQMAELQSQLSSLRAQAGSSVRQITAPQAGLYSAVVDGYENILTPESLETLTPRTLAALEPDESLRSNRVGKLVLGDTWYYVTALEESEAQTLQESGRLKLRFAKGVGRDLSVKLTYISEAEGGRVVAVFQGDTYLSELTLLRQQSAEVIRQTTTGIRVPKEALRVRERTVTDEDGNESVVSETGVYCMVGMKARFKPVDVLYSGDDFALVRSTLDTAEEVSKTQEQIRLRAGDEVDASETIQEKTSLSDRFGLRIPYLALNQAEFLELVEGMAEQVGITLDRDSLRAEAVKWEMRSPGRTPRTAKQFIASLSL